MSRKELLLSSLTVVAGVVIGGIALLAAAYGLNLFSFPAVWWRDHPFDFANILHTTQTFSLASRLWSYDPLHLFGWTPNVFYNPLATASAGIFVSLFGSTEGAYRAWLLFLLFGTSLAFLSLLPRDCNKSAWIAGGLSAAFLSLLIYPKDVGILDANPVQVLYTGQWAQRLGLALGILAIGFMARALESLEEGYRQSARKTLAAAALLGAATFCHYMSGYAAVAAGAMLSVLYLLSRRLTKGDWSFWSLLVLPAALLGACLLFLDFFYVFLSLSGSHHNLPLLGWRVPEGALETVREVVVPALPVLLIPLGRTLMVSDRSRPELSRALLPLLVLIAVVAAAPKSLLLWFLVVLVATLAASRVENEFRQRHWLPASAFFLLLLASGPDSLRVFGLDLSVLVPFSGSIGWAKLAAFSRFLFLAWVGVLVAEGLTLRYERRRAIARITVGSLTLLGLLLPLFLSVGAGKEKTGAQSYFGWMNETDLKGTQALLLRMQGVAARTPENGYLLVEDTLHHPEGSALRDTRIPNGHLPYLLGGQSFRPVLGGSVTTRLITHPFAHTSRGQLLCTDYPALAENPAPVLDHIRELGVSDMLVHSRELIRALERYPAALRVDKQGGMVHFALEHYRPILTDGDGLHLDGGRLKWNVDGAEVEVPAGTPTALLRQVYYPFLRCTAVGGGVPVDCTLSPWTEGKQLLSGCLVDDPKPVEFQVPWIRIDIEPTPAGVTHVNIHSRPPILPFIIMLLSWLAALAICCLGKVPQYRRRKGEAA